MSCYTALFIASITIIPMLYFVKLNGTAPIVTKCLALCIITVLTGLRLGTSRCIKVVLGKLAIGLAANGTYCFCSTGSSSARMLVLTARKKGKG